MRTLNEIQWILIKWTYVALSVKVQIPHSYSTLWRHVIITSLCAPTSPCPDDRVVLTKNNVTKNTKLKKYNKDEALRATHPLVLLSKAS
jgi:hypothetical protein